MFLYVFTVLALNAGLVHNSVIPICGEIASSFSESMSSSSMSQSSFEKEFSSSVAENDGEFGSSYEKSESQSYSEQASSSYQSASSSTSSFIGSIDVSIFENAFSQCANLESAQRDLYINYLRKLGPNDLCDFQNLIEKLNCKEQFLAKELDFNLIRDKFHSIYEKLQAEKFYEANCNWAEKAALLEEYKSHLNEVLDILKNEKILYGPLNYCLNKDIEYLPMVCGLYDIILDNQQPFYESASSSSVTESSGSSTTRDVSKTTQKTTTSTSTTTIDIAACKEALTSCSSIQQTERDLYEKYLSELSEDNLALFSDIMQNLNSKEQFLTEGMITDFSLFQEKIRNAYDLFTKEEIYSSGCDWLQKKCTFEKAKAELQAALELINKDCCLYSSLNWCLQDQYIHYLPMVIGLDNIIISSQSSFFSTSSSTTTYESSTTEVSEASASSASGSSCGC